MKEGNMVLGNIDSEQRHPSIDDEFAHIVNGVRIRGNTRSDVYGDGIKYGKARELVEAWDEKLGEPHLVADPDLVDKMSKQRVHLSDLPIFTAAISGGVLNAYDGTESPIKPKDSKRRRRVRI